MSKIFLVIGSIVLSIGIGGGVGYGIYAAIETSEQTKQPNYVEIVDNSSIPNEFKTFSEQNSFKVSLQISNPNSDGYYSVSQGTAWSWYYVNSTNSFEWYLFTNYHVINDAIDFLTNSQYDKNILTIPFNYTFLLQNWDSTARSYNYLLNTNKSWQNLRSIQIINDNDINNFDLFSNNTNLSNHYNLDIGLIKLTFNTKPSFFNQYRIANPYLNYLNNTNENQPENNSYYIAGNPGVVNGSSNNAQLIYELATINNFQDSYIKMNQPNPENKISISKLNQISEPVQMAINPYKNWDLTAGSSGSAVYLVNDKIKEFVDLYYAIPYGIYWGGETRGNNSSLFYPSFVKLINSNYNIYKNFQTLYNQHII